MAERYLDYDGLKTYHDELVRELKHLEFDPQRMFDTQEDIVTPSNWEADKYGRVFGLKVGLIVTVGNKIWQLTDPGKFVARMNTVGETIAAKAALAPEVLGWKIVGCTTDFDVDEHLLKLMK